MTQAQAQTPRPIWRGPVARRIKAELRALCKEADALTAYRLKEMRATLRETL